MKLMTVGVAALLLCGCAESGPSREELEAEIESLQQQISSAREYAEYVDSASSELSDAVSRFNDENWREVVPDVRSASDDLESASAELNDALNR
jgi:ABC-type transporter Mla subunit MlaD